MLGILESKQNHAQAMPPFSHKWSPQRNRRGFQVDVEPVSKSKTTAVTGKTFDDDANTVNINHPMFSSFQPPTKCFSIEHPIHQSNQDTSNLKAASNNFDCKKKSDVIQ